MNQNRTSPSSPADGQQDLDARLAAARIIRRWLATDDFPDRQLEQISHRHAFVMELVIGVVKWRRALDWIARRYVPRQADEPVRAFLLVGLYQVLHMSSVADYAVVHATVAAACAEGLPARRTGFINAVLRKAVSDRAALRGILAAQPLGIRLSHPDALLERWTRRWGEERSASICAWDNNRPDVVLRVNTLRTNATQLRAALAGQAIDAAPHSSAPDEFVILPHGIRVQDVPGFTEGWFVVQDPSTALAVNLLDPQPGDDVLDACAAPGGKTVAIALRMAGRGGRLVAMEIHTDRLPRLTATVQRMCGDDVMVAQGDITIPAGVEDRVDPLDGRRFDRILLDVPCTNTGVLRRRADARWRFSIFRLDELHRMQRAMLDGAASRLNPGGTIVYSTCSIEPEENGTLAHSWLADRPDFSLQAESFNLPGDHGMDGAYATALRHKT